VDVESELRPVDRELTPDWAVETPVDADVDSELTPD
jgi:hypothetical protein